MLTRRIKFVFASNHPPCIEGEDDALLKRIVYLPFDTSIPDDQQDPDLEEKIWKERNAIVTKALRYRILRKLVELKLQNFLKFRRWTGQNVRRRTLTAGA